MRSTRRCSPAAALLAAERSVVRRRMADSSTGPVGPGTERLDPRILPQPFTRLWVSTTQPYDAMILWAADLSTFRPHWNGPRIRSWSCSSKIRWSHIQSSCALADASELKHFSVHAVKRPLADTTGDLIAIGYSTLVPLK